MSILSLRRHSRGLGLSPRRRAAPGAALPIVVQDGLVAEWRFNDGAGQQISDSSGNGFHAQLGPTSGVDSGEPVWSATGLDMIERSEGNNYVPVGGNLGITGSASRTVCAVASVDLTDLGSTSFGYGFFGWLDGGASSGDMWALNVDAGTGRLRISTAFGQGFAHPTALADEGWHFVAAVQDGTRLGDVTLYLDGETPFGESFWSTVFATVGNGYMGPNGEAATGSFKDGRHAYCVVYDRALSAAEIAQNRTTLSAVLAGRGITLP